ncbi:MAG: ATP synthase F1 subunit gamma [Bacteroidales bacterium]|nr:ATP synthase F1 subunit gamma [Bacteroidales bacterium]
MANLKEIRNRIASVTSTRQITSAMKMVAAAKLRKAQLFATKISPYKHKMQEMLSLLTETLADDNDNIYTKIRPIKNILVIAISSNKGLCGAFNSNIIKSVVEFDKKQKDINPNINIQYYGIGKKVSEQISKRGLILYKSDFESIDKVSYQTAGVIAEEITKLFVDGEFDDIKIIYNKFVNAAVQNTEIENFLPLQFKTEESKYKSDYIFEPDKLTIVNKMIPQWLKTQFLSILAESAAGEQGARMTSMNKATDNASELIKELNISYNKVRQASITNEIIEIVSGANAAK